MKFIPKLIPKVLLFYIGILLFSLFLAKNLGMPTYPPTDFKALSWLELKEEFPRLSIAAFILSIMAYYFLYWDYINKNKSKETDCDKHQHDLE